MLDLAQFDPLPPATETDGKALRVFLRSRAEGPSRETAERTLARLARLLGYEEVGAVPWTALNYEHGQYLTNALNEGREPATTNTYMGVLRGLVKEARRARVIGHGAPCTALLDLAPVECDKEEAAAGRALSDDEVARLIKACRDDPSREAGKRDEAIIRLLWATGLRRETLCKLDLDDLDLDRATVTARGKRRKRHVMPLDPDTLAVLRDYLAVRGDWAGPLWVGSTPGRPPHRLLRRRFRGNALYEMLLRRAVEAKVERFSPHDFRRTFVTDMIRRAGLRTAQRLANHSSPAMTALYDRSGREAMEEAVNGRKLKLPDAS